MRRPRGKSDKGKLKIGDDWNAITIIASSQNNPLKAIAEFVENSIDAKATEITIIRGREKKEYYLKIIDNGAGIPRDEAGQPDFKYVATHICDSLKRRIKKEGMAGLQGEFGIGLLSFWTVGERLIVSSAGSDNKVYQMIMEKDKPGYRIGPRSRLFGQKGAELHIQPILPGVRLLNGEKIQNYLAAELRDRIRKTGVMIKIIDRHARKEFRVEPRQFEGTLIHNLPQARTESCEIYCELYLSRPDASHRVGLYKSGTRVIEDITRCEAFRSFPWTSGYLQGLIDMPGLRLTPGTRDGVIFDDAFQHFAEAMIPVTEKIKELVEEQKKAEEDKTSASILRSVQNAFREALLALPSEEYDWFDLRNRKGREEEKPDSQAASGEEDYETDSEPEGTKEGQKRFFEYAGPLHKVRVSPASAVVRVKNSRNFRAVCRDKAGRPVGENLSFIWRILEGAGTLSHTNGEISTFTAGDEPGLCRIETAVMQGSEVLQAEAIVTVTDSLVEQGVSSSLGKKGLPGYTYQHAAGELWRSRFDAEKNLVVINNGHRDFVFASRNAARKLRYICKLFAKELVLHNFPGATTDQLLERMVELSLFTEENL